MSAFMNNNTEVKQSSI